MLLDPWLRVLMLAGIWLFLSGVATWGLCRWFRWMRDQDWEDNPNRMDRE